MSSSGCDKSLPNRVPPSSAMIERPLLLRAHLSPEQIANDDFSPISTQIQSASWSRKTSDKATTMQKHHFVHCPRRPTSISHFRAAGLTRRSKYKLQGAIVAETAGYLQLANQLEITNLSGPPNTPCHRPEYRLPLAKTPNLQP